MNADYPIIEIALAADSAYAAGLQVTAVSMALSATRDCRLSYTFLDGGFDDGFYGKMCARLQEAHPHVRTRRFKVDEEMFADFPAWRGNKMAYARFLLPELLPGVHHVIYCDVDFMWRKDIAELWNSRNDGVPLCAVHDPQIHEIPENREWFLKRDLHYDETQYFCTGLLMMNLELFRKHHIVDQVYAFLSQHKDVMFPDQDALNSILWGRVRLLDPKWMVFSRYVTSALFKTPFVCHFACDAPWMPQCLLLKLRDSTMAWRFLAERMGLMPLPIVLKVLYLVTRLPVVRHLIYAILTCAGKSYHAHFLRERCSCWAGVVR